GRRDREPPTRVFVRARGRRRARPRYRAPGRRGHRPARGRRPRRGARPRDHRRALPARVGEPRVRARPCWGIFRERAPSPGRESDDAEILRLTAKALEARGYVVHLREPDDVDVRDGERPGHVLLMGERVALLRTLHRWEALGTQVVNTPQAVL